MNYLDKAKEILAGMSFDEKIGQMFVVRCPRERAVESIAEYKLGGYTLYAVDFDGQTPESVRKTISEYQNTANLPMFIAADEEGGRVVRASKYPQFRAEPFMSPSQLYAAGGFELIASDTREKAAFLKDLGVNFNYAPVCDMSTSPENFIYDRTLGRDADDTAKYAETVVREMNASKLIGSIKHFPGYGDNVDTHTKVAHDPRSLEQFMSNDLKPFIAAINAGAPVVMIAHNIVECLDPVIPASISPAVHKFLRETLGFTGIIMTDSLDMNAITLYIGDQAAAVAAVTSGNDLLCCSSFEKQVPAVRQAVRDGFISMEQIDASVLKIIELKLKTEIIK